MQTDSEIIFLHIYEKHKSGHTKQMQITLFHSVCIHRYGIMPPPKPLYFQKNYLQYIIFDVEIEIFLENKPKFDNIY